MELRTERTVIRPWRPEEADRLYDIVRRREVTEWLGRPEPWTPEQVDEFIAGNQQTAQIPIRCAIVPQADPLPVAP
jgi:RimJ/RimL family protein N-acetyltransferase